MTYLAQYQAFGNQVATYGSTLDRQKSNSKDTDPTGLVDEGMRYYDLLTETFITRDPAGMIDGPNEYTYVRQNPWTAFDAEGLLMSMSQVAVAISASELGDGPPGWAVCGGEVVTGGVGMTVIAGSLYMGETGRSLITHPPEIVDTHRPAPLGDGIAPSPNKMIPGVALINPTDQDHLDLAAANNTSDPDEKAKLINDLNTRNANRNEKDSSSSAPGNKSAQTTSSDNQDRQDAMKIHALIKDKDPIKFKNQTIAINTQTLPDGSTRRLGSANSSAGLTTDQAAEMLRLGIEPVKPEPRSTDNHAEDNIINYTNKNDPGAVSQSWGISKGAKQGSQPCEECAPKVQSFGGTVQQ